MAGTRWVRAGPGRLLGLAPMRAIGAVSYTWYLWHWPALILAPFVLGHQLELGQKVGIGLFSLLLAALTTVLVEQPLRRSAWLSAGKARSLLAGGALSLGAAAMAVAVVAAVPPPVGSGHASVVRLSAARDPHSRSSPTVSPAVSAADSLNTQVNKQVYESLANPNVPANLTPSLVDAAADLPVPEDDGCFNSFTDASVHSCLYGDTTSAKTIVLFGDSHALQWFPAIDSLANQQHDALVVMAKATCPPVDVPVYSPELGRSYTECDEWKTAELARMATLHPAVVILGFSREYGIANDHVIVDGPAWLSGLTEMITTIQKDTSGRVVLMGDDPYPQQNVPQCLSENLSNTPILCDPEALSVLQPERDPAGEGCRSLDRRRLRGHRPVVLHLEHLHRHRGKPARLPRRQPHHRDVRQLADPGGRRAARGRYGRGVLRIG